MIMKDIDDIVPVGGSSRIPMVQQMLRELFFGKKPLRTVSTYEAVVFGAAVQVSFSDHLFFFCPNVLFE